MTSIHKLSKIRRIWKSTANWWTIKGLNSRRQWTGVSKRKPSNTSSRRPRITQKLEKAATKLLQAIHRKQIFTPELTEMLFKFRTVSHFFTQWRTTFGTITWIQTWHVLFLPTTSRRSHILMYHHGVTQNTLTPSPRRSVAQEIQRLVN